MRFAWCRIILLLLVFAALRPDVAVGFDGPIIGPGGEGPAGEIFFPPVRPPPVLTGKSYADLDECNASMDSIADKFNCEPLSPSRYQCELKVLNYRPGVFCDHRVPATVRSLLDELRLRNLRGSITVYVEGHVDHQEMRRQVPWSEIGEDCHLLRDQLAGTGRAVNEIVSNHDLAGLRACYFIRHFRLLLLEKAFSAHHSPAGDFNPKVRTFEEPVRIGGEWRGIDVKVIAE